MSPTLLLRLVIFGTLTIQLRAQAPTPPPIRPIPPPGVAIPDGDRAELQAGVTGLGKEITVLRHNLKAKPELAALLPDVMIFHKAVDWALRYDEFFDVKQVAVAKRLLELGNQRAAELRSGKSSWTSATGLVPRGYLSKIDGSVQPYGMVIPGEWKAGEQTGRRLDFWCHGRGEKLSELSFLDERLAKRGEFAPPGAFTLHLYGRYCCANKFAGEADLLEALENARMHYAIDPAKLVIRGFSMGGAAVWQFGTHFAGMWAVVQPGAGFAETREFNKVYAAGKTPPTWWEEVLYRWYDATDSVANLANTTTVAYSGEIDGQKQAADIMIRSARQEAGQANPPAAVANKVNPGDGSPSISEAKVTGTAPDVEFYHVIGPQTPHKIKPEAKPQIEAMIDEVLARKQAVPKSVRFTTYSLVYPRMEWVTVLGMEKHWERGEVRADVGPDGTATVTTKNVSILSLPGAPMTKPKVVIDGQSVAVAPSKSPDGPYYQKVKGQWTCRGLLAEDYGNRKRPTVCGPIDHAFMSSFIFVRPTGKPLNDKVGAWATGELEHAIGFWRKVFRGEAPVKDDTAITDADLAASNLVLWGDPSSNAVLKRLLGGGGTGGSQASSPAGQRPSAAGRAASLPAVQAGGLSSVLHWDATKMVFGGKTYDAAHHAPVLIFPNPLNPARYIVLNSGPTFREEALLNNSQQIPKLPDWAIIDLRTPPDGAWPGAVVNAGFFDEQWEMPAGPKK